MRRGYLKGIAEGIKALWLLGPMVEWWEKIEEAEKKKKKLWIQDVVKRAERKGTKGKMREWCQKRGYTRVTKACIQDAKREARKTGDTTLLRRAIAAENMMRAAGLIK